MKRLFLFALIISFINTFAFADPKQANISPAQKKLAELEKNFDGKVGVYAINTQNNQIIAYRANEPFPVQSTFKLIGVAALLKQQNANHKSLQEIIHYTNNDLIFWHPVTGKHVITGMTLEALSEAAITYSDNTAINLIIKKLGGPQSISDFAHSIGNKTFNVEHYECKLNSNPKFSADTSTPQDMANSLQKIILGSILTPSQREQLMTWMRNNAVGYKRIRAGVPIGWVVADKTGSGDYGVANDIGILWSPVCKPVILAIYTVQNKQNAKSRDDIVASATKTVIDDFAAHDPCFKELII